MPTLYLTVPGSVLERRQDQLVARVGSLELARVPLEWLDLVVVQGACELTSASVRACLGRGVPIAYLDARGDYLGRLEPVSPRVAALQRAQLIHGQDGDACLALARAVVVAKLRNSGVVAHEWEGWTDDAAATVHRAIAGAAEARDPDVLRGYEGAGAAAYFRALVRWQGAQWGFEGRAFRPSPDPLNALLSYAYTLLRVRVAGAIAAVGLNPYVGFFHADREGHASLASDLMEEWRPVVADRLVVALVTGGALAPRDFEPDEEGGCRLGADARRLFLRAWESKLERRITLPSLGEPLPLRVAFVQQALHFARHVRGPEEEPYQPVVVR